ncbi:hypothetical protein VKT23_014149 [Stygiomarasmius scandens]|uniref:Uncharacterized protein n=1 Tax=Marasmiellus scandens TaxID=2682957 RepID=A0ABR1J1F2_9AGAR
MLYAQVTPLLAALFPVVVIYMAALEEKNSDSSSCKPSSPASASLTRSIQFASARSAESRPTRGHQRLASDEPLQIQSFVFEPLLLSDIERYTGYDSRIKPPLDNKISETSTSSY